MAQVAGGPGVETSNSPSSEFAADVASFAEEALEEVLDGDVSADCFVEARTEEEGGVYVVLTLPSSPPPGAVQAVGDAMKQMGADVAGAYSSTYQYGTFDMITIQSMPVEPPRGTLAMGGLYFVSTQNGVYHAVMLVSYQDDSSQAIATSGGDLPSGSETNLPAVSATPIATTAVPPVVAVVPTGVAGAINNDVKPALEEALGVSLVVESFFQTSAEGNNTVVISYVIDGSLPTLAGLQDGFSDTVNRLGGTASFSYAGEGTTSVIFDGLKAGGFNSISGGFSYTQDQIVVTLTSVSNQ
jgi:hypothetical protein